MRDHEFIAARWVDMRIPKREKYLSKYFKTPVQKEMLKYFFVFGDLKCFPQHTGWYATPSYCHRQVQRIEKLRKVYAQAREDMDMDQIWLIESGRFPLNGLE